MNELNFLEALTYIVIAFFCYAIPVALARNLMNEKYKGNGADQICGMIGIFIYVLIHLNILHS